MVARSITFTVDSPVCQSASLQSTSVKAQGTKALLCDRLPSFGIQLACANAALECLRYRSTTFPIFPEPHLPSETSEELR